jgi:transcriptional regulator with XRE-family HTH domain
MPVEVSMNFGERLKELRDKAGLSQQELADKAGIHRVAVARIETGERSPAWDTAMKLAAALGVSCAAFEPQRSGKK